MPNPKPWKTTFESRDGFLLQGEWHASGNSDQRSSHVAIISPGMGIPARFYRPFARHLVDRGMDVLLFDFRGIGWSAVDTLSSLQANATTWGRLDLSSAIDRAISLSGGKSLIGIGHSFGGSIFGFTDNVQKISKQIHICSQSGYYGFYDWKTRLYMLFNIHIAMPLLTRWLGYYPAHWLSGSEALPSGFVAEWSDWCLRKEYFMDERFEVRDKASHGCYEGPLLSLSFSDDAFATQQSVDAMAAFYSSSQLERMHLNPADYEAESLGHFGVFKRANGRLIWELIANWANRE
jgi:predicted alpha/beta hydrolase